MVGVDPRGKSASDDRTSAPGLAPTPTQDSELERPQSDTRAPRQLEAAPKGCPFAQAAVLPIRATPQIR